ncbi:acyl CoA:acetate/3-ketoacid CoA transferase [uncultured Dubosiella sp.]|uniref:acyl CoA:acetate/3-ketoacid CoA transferase n=1 Tax=uncultured Dubosiella sp. TaxID=1937011 RepID=UPI002731EF22|nr:acyl CoA:acetate/3-ketoacid CoA transferase [uncultured Dubosiella sp.]
MAKVITPEEAAGLIKDGDRVVISGFIGMCFPQEVVYAVEDRFLKDGHPKDIDLFFPTNVGDGTDKLGMNHLAHEGLLRSVVGGHWNLIPAIQKLVTENKVQAYNLPIGTLAQLLREIAAKRPGVITKIGLNTFVDPRLQGGKMNEITKEDLVEVMEIDGEEYLRYKPFKKINVGIIRGTYADENGNLSMEKEAAFLEALAMAEAVKNTGGIVIAQVEDVVQNGTLNPKDVKVPGILVDYIVKGTPANSWQTYLDPYKPEFSGQIKKPLNALEPMPLNARKVVCRRAAMELTPNAIINLGIGMPEGVANVGNEEGLQGLKMTVEAGNIGGVPASGVGFGASTNPDCTIDSPSMFDFYDGGGLSQAFLGLAECDQSGNINVSRFGPRIAGCGGFINITQSTPVVVFCGTFTAKGLKEKIGDGKLEIVQEGQIKKFKEAVEQITFSSEFATKAGQKVLYITERAVFELRDGVFTLTEIAPGIDLQKDVLDQMEFKPAIAKDLKRMDERLFKDELMGLSQ